MVKRMIAMLTVTLAIVGGLGFVKFRQIQTAMAEGAAFQPPPEAVTTLVARQEQWPATLERHRDDGGGAGRDGQRRPARHGRARSCSSRGTRCAPATCWPASTRGRSRRSWRRSKPQRELASLTFDRMQGLLNERVVSQAEFDRAAADHRRSDAQVREIRAVIQRKTIRAPFSGILGIRQVNLGQYLAGGDALVTLQSLNPIYVNFGVPQQIGPPGPGRARGARQRPTALAGAGWTGRVTAIDSLVDAATRNIQVQATLANPDGTAAAGHVRAGRGRARRRASRSSRCRRRRSATPRTATRCSSSTDHRRGPDGKPTGRAPAVRQARDRRAATRWRCSPASSRATRW